MNMNTRVRRLSWFNGLDALQPPGNCSHVKKAESGQLLTNLVYTVQGISKKGREKAYCTRLGILEGLVSAREGGLHRRRRRVNLTSSWG
jgi:hypothetical protein